MAFFNTPGTDRLYSGVANSTASAALIFALNSATGFAGLASSSWL
jgi:hypothetical protein